MKTIADNKTVKFGEPRKGNTELSLLQESVETRRQIKKLCLNCNKILGKHKSKFCGIPCRNQHRRKTKLPLQNCIFCNNPIKNRYANALYCGIKCRNRYTSYKWRVKKGLIKKPGVGSGHAQGIGKTHHTYKNGRKHFREIALKYYEHKCYSCGKKKVKLDVHHKDFDVTQSNNDLTNLIPLCRGCHKKVHSGKITLKV